LNTIAEIDPLNVAVSKSAVTVATRFVFSIKLDGFEVGVVDGCDEGCSVGCVGLLEG
jgi:hypothetical protein